MIFRYVYVHDGTPWYADRIDLGHTDPWIAADRLLFLPLAQGCDEVRVWAGNPPGDQPDAVVVRDGVQVACCGCGTTMDDRTPCGGRYCRACREATITDRRPEVPR
jgi:hypothetical protein